MKNSELLQTQRSDLDPIEKQRRYVLRCLVQKNPCPNCAHALNFFDGAGNDVSYGMGLEVDREWGIPVVHHGGSMIGYKSDMFYLPEHDIAAVILVNSDEGGRILNPFGRRLLEVLFDGKLEAEENVADVLTKALARDKHGAHAVRAGLKLA